MFRECHECGSREVSFSENLKNETCYHQWVTEKINRLGAKGLNYCVQVTSKKILQCTIAELINLFNFKLTTFLKHMYEQFLKLRQI